MGCRDVGDLGCGVPIGTRQGGGQVLDVVGGGGFFEAIVFCGGPIQEQFGGGLGFFY